MKTAFRFFSAFIFTVLFTTGMISEIFAQAQKPEVKLMFYRHKDGKIANYISSEQKVFDCVIEGLITQNDVDNFKSLFVGRPYVVAVRISELYNGNQRKASFTLETAAKAEQIKELLLQAGITTVWLDGEMINVEDMGKDVKSPNRK